MAKSNDEILASLRNFAKTEKKFRANDMQRIKHDLEFVSGSQFTAKDKGIRGENRAEIVFNVTRNYCLQIINAFRKNPFGIVVNARTEQSVEDAEMIQGLIRGWQSQVSALDEYVLAADRQVKAGQGYWVMSTEYQSGTGWDQDVTLSALQRPDMCLFDANSKYLDGRDARKVAVVEHISDEEAKELTGVEDADYLRADSPYIDTPWVAPDNSVEMTTFYELTRKPTKVYLDKDGNTVKAETMRKNANTAGMRSRDTYKTTVQISKIVGSEVISSEEYQLSRIPVVPVRGELADIDGKQTYVGLVHSAKDPARLINWAASMVTEKLAIAPKTTRIVDSRAVANHLREWQQSNKLNLPYLPVDTIDPSGNAIPMPVPDNPVIDLDSPSRALAMYSDLLQDVLGMQAQGADTAGPANETAAAVLTRSKSQETANYQYPDNLAKALKALGKLWIEMMLMVVDSPRRMAFVDSMGNKGVIDADLSGIDPDMFDIDVDAGPMQATQRKEAVSMLLALGQMIGPEASLLLAPDVAMNSELPGAMATAKKLAALAGSKLGTTDPQEGGQDPEAVAAIQQIQEQARTQIQAMQEQLNQSSMYIQQLEAERADKTLELQVAREKMMADYKRAIDVEMLKQQGSLTDTQMKIQADAEKQFREAMAETAHLIRSPRDISVISGAVPNMPSIGGQHNDLRTI